jgi:hypothetical protein
MPFSKRESERQEQRNIHSESQSQPPSVNSAGGRDLVDTKTVFTSKGNLFPLKQSVLLTYETIISYAYPAIY